MKWTNRQHVCQSPCSCQNSFLFDVEVSCHVIGAIVHDRGHHVHEIPSDSNATCNVIIQTIIKKDDLLPVLEKTKQNNVFGL